MFSPSVLVCARSEDQAYASNGTACAMAVSSFTTTATGARASRSPGVALEKFSKWPRCSGACVKRVFSKDLTRIRRIFPSNPDRFLRQCDALEGADDVVGAFF